MDGNEVQGNLAQERFLMVRESLTTSYPIGTLPEFVKCRIDERNTTRVYLLRYRRPHMSDKQYEYDVLVRLGSSAYMERQDSFLLENRGTERMTRCFQHENK